MSNSLEIDGAVNSFTANSSRTCGSSRRSAGMPPRKSPGASCSGGVTLSGTSTCSSADNGSANEATAPNMHARRDLMQEDRHRPERSATGKTPSEWPKRRCFYGKIWDCQVSRAVPTSRCWNDGAAGRDEFPKTPLSLTSPCPTGFRLPSRQLHRFSRGITLFHPVLRTCE